MTAADDTTAPSASIIATFKAIADESRLKIVAHLSTGPASVTELAELTGLRPPTVSHHLAVLDRAGLVSVEQRGTTRLYSFVPEGLADARRSLTEERGLASFADDDDLEAWEKKVLETFCDGQTISQIPASEKKRLVLVRWMAGKFETGVDYPESEVNEIIKRHHEDSAYFRRAMVDNAIMTRTNSVYRKL